MTEKTLAMLVPGSSIMTFGSHSFFKKPLWNLRKDQINFEFLAACIKVLRNSLAMNVSTFIVFCLVCITVFVDGEQWLRVKRQFGALRPSLGGNPNFNAGGGGGGFNNEQFGDSFNGGGGGGGFFQGQDNFSNRPGFQSQYNQGFNQQGGGFNRPVGGGGGGYFGGGGYGTGVGGGLTPGGGGGGVVGYGR